MMSDKNIIISIKEPCNEDWNKMTTNKSGKFCDLCNENVIDFTDLSDKEIVRIIKRNNGKLCGRFNTEQLERPLAINPKDNNYSFFAKVAATLLLFTVTKETTGQSEKPIHDSTFSSDKQMKSNAIAGNRQSLIELTGTVIDASTNKPIANAKIQIVSPVFPGSSTVYKTDEDGNYSIPIADSTEKRTISLFIAAADYQETTIKISYEDYSTQNNVLLSPASNDIVITSYNLKKFKSVVGAVTVIDSSKLKPKKNFNFFNLFRKKKNWK